MFNALFGSSSNLANSQLAYNQNQAASGQHAANMSAQQQAMYNQYAQGMFNQVAADRQHRWMIDGRTMTWDEWLDELAPGEDNSLRTFLILKYKQ